MVNNEDLGRSFAGYGLCPQACAEILARAEALAERRRIIRNRRCEEAGFTALLGAETGQADLEEALERALRETAGDYYCPVSGRVLILADRLYAQALALQYFLFRCTALDVAGVAWDGNSAERLLAGGPAGLLIMAGLQEDDGSYDLIPDLQSRFGARSLLWAGQDRSTALVCTEKKITCRCDRHAPFPLLVSFIIRTLPRLARRI